MNKLKNLLLCIIIAVSSSSFATPLSEAVQFQSLEEIEELLEDDNVLSTINDHDEYGLTPLMESTLRGHQGIIDSLLKRRANINAKSRRSRWTALMLATYRKKHLIVEDLLKRGAEYLGSEREESALGIAVRIEAKNVEEVIKKHVPNIFACYLQALNYTILKDDFETFKKLLGNDEISSKKIAYLKYAFTFALAKRHYAFVRWWLKQEENINSNDSELQGLRTHLIEEFNKLKQEQQKKQYAKKHRSTSALLLPEGNQPLNQ